MVISSRHARLLRRTTWPAAAALAAATGLAILASAHHPASRAAPTFGWLRPAPAPSGWHLALTRTGARLAYPAGWRQIQTDRGTASAAPAGPAGSFAGYLNATPLGGDETLANWSRFRVAHVASEGAREVRLQAAATGLHFRSGQGSCVVDSYSTSKARFREIACIVAGARATTVVIAAAPAHDWSGESGVLERAVASFTT